MNECTPTQQTLADGTCFGIATPTPDYTHVPQPHEGYPPVLAPPPTHDCPLPSVPMSDGTCYTATVTTPTPAPGELAETGGTLDPFTLVGVTLLVVLAGVALLRKSTKPSEPQEEA